MAALLAYAAVNVLLAVLDVGTYSTGTQSLLDFMRNAQYTLHLEDQVEGMKRIVGSYPEASAFARCTLGALAFTGTLWLCGRSPTLTGPLALISLVLVVLSTSSTGLAGTPAVLLILYMTMMLRSGFHPRSRPFASAAALGAPVLVGVVTLAVLLNDSAYATVSNYLDDLIFTKSLTSSGIERSAWNTYGMQNFFDSLGLGVGLGTVRTSSFPVALLANVGIPGTIFYVLFAVSAFFRRRGTPRSFPSDVRMAARNACLALIIGDTFAAPNVEQGLVFYVLAAVACAEPEREYDEVELATQRLSGARA